MIKEKANIAVFISGRGTNLKALILRSKKKRCSYKIAYVISNKKNATGLKIAKKNKILTKIISQSFLKTEQKKLAKILVNKDIKFVCLAGFMKILSPYFLDFFKNKIINIHPSLLPKYGGRGMYGLNIHKKVIENEESETGITIHYISEEYDSGKIIFQKKIKVDKYDTPEKLEEKIHKLEYEYFPKVIESLLI